VVDTFPPAPNVNNKNFAVLLIRPKNKFGYYMGPGFSSKINLKIKSKTHKTHKASLFQVNNERPEPFLSKIKDNLDGSYYLYIANIKDVKKWDFSITIRDEVLHNYAQTIPLWIYIVLVVLILVIYLARKSNKMKVVSWLLFLIWLIFILLHYTGYLNIL